MKKYILISVVLILSIGCDNQQTEKVEKSNLELEKEQIDEHWANVINCFEKEDFSCFNKELFKYKEIGKVLKEVESVSYHLDKKAEADSLQQILVIKSAEELFKEVNSK